MPDLTAIDKIKTPDGVVHDFSTTHNLVLSDNMMNKLFVTWNISGFSGSTTKITGTDDDYRLNVNEQRS